MLRKRQHVLQERQLAIWCTVGLGRGTERVGRAIGKGGQSGQAADAANSIAVEGRQLLQAPSHPQLLWQ